VIREERGRRGNELGRSNGGNINVVEDIVAIDIGGNGGFPGKIVVLG
jgi:hypothetical protein